MYNIMKELLCWTNLDLIDLSIALNYQVKSTLKFYKKTRCLK